MSRIQQIREWLDQPLSGSSVRRLEAQAQADADQARRRLAELDRELRAGGDPGWYAQEYDRVSDDLDYALGRGPYKD